MRRLRTRAVARIRDVDPETGSETRRAGVRRVPPDTPGTSRKRPVLRRLAEVPGRPLHEPDGYCDAVSCTAFVRFRQAASARRAGLAPGRPNAATRRERPQRRRCSGQLERWAERPSRTERKTPATRSSPTPDQLTQRPTAPSAHQSRADAANLTVDICVTPFSIGVVPWT